MKELHAYMIQFDSTQWVVIAESLIAAVEKWQKAREHESAGEYTLGEEEPESVARIYGQVII